jgi:hypothetical protein
VAIAEPRKARFFAEQKMRPNEMEEADTVCGRAGKSALLREKKAPCAGTTGKMQGAEKEKKEKGSAHLSIRRQVSEG